MNPREISISRGRRRATSRPEGDLHLPREKEGHLQTRGRATSGPDEIIRILMNPP